MKKTVEIATIDAYSLQNIETLDNLKHVNVSSGAIHVNPLLNAPSLQSVFFFKSPKLSSNQGTVDRQKNAVSIGAMTKKGIAVTFDPGVKGLIMTG